MRRVNVFTTEITPSTDRPDGFQAARLRIAPLLGGDAIGASVFDLPAGQTLFPYHYEYGNEEWLLVLTGRPMLRHPGGEDQLEPGDVVAFPEGPDGAHQLFNRTAESARLVMFSTNIEPAVAVYPDSNKVGVWAGDDRIDLMVRDGEKLDYWDGEI